MSAFPVLRFPRAADYSHALRVVAAVLLALIAAAHVSAQSPEFAADVEERVIALTNEARAKNGAAPLQAESRLTDAARDFARHLAGAGRLEHDADGTTPAERVKKRGYSFCIVAENLAMEYSSGGFTP